MGFTETPLRLAADRGFTHAVRPAVPIKAHLNSAYCTGTHLRTAEGSPCPARCGKVRVLILLPFHAAPPMHYCTCTHAGIILVFSRSGKLPVPVMHAGVHTAQSPILYPRCIVAHC